MPVTFRCQDCRAHVWDGGLDAVPDPPRCQICRWIADAPAADHAALRAALGLPTPPGLRIERIQGEAC